MHVTLALQEKWREAVLRWLTKLGQRHMEWIYSDSSERSYKKVLLRQCEMEEGMRHVEVEYMIMTDPADEDIDMSDMSAALPEVNEDFDTTDFGDAFADMEH